MALRDIRSGRHTPEQFRLPRDREAETVLLVPANWPPGVERRIPDQVAPDALPVHVNHGRWIVECPCGSAQLASRTDRRFFCVECGNVTFEGKWVRVEWPSDSEVAEIEQALQERPFATYQNWSPGETVQELKVETAAHRGKVR